MCGVESRSPPDSIPVGEACKNSVPFEDRLKPDRYNLELAVGLTFFRAGCLVNQDDDEKFWADELVTEFASAPLGSWANFKQNGTENQSTLDKQWLVLMYALVTELP